MQDSESFPLNGGIEGAPDLDLIYIGREYTEFCRQESLDKMRDVFENPQNFGLEIESADPFPPVRSGLKQLIHNTANIEATEIESGATIVVKVSVPGIIASGVARLRGRPVMVNQYIRRSDVPNLSQSA